MGATARSPSPVHGFIAADARLIYPERAIKSSISLPDIAFLASAGLFAVAANPYHRGVALKQDRKLRNGLIEHDERSQMD
jgi:hypothetical protein